MESAGEEGGLTMAVAEELRAPVQAAFDQALNAVFTAGAEVAPALLASSPSAQHQLLEVGNQRPWWAGAFRLVQAGSSSALHDQCKMTPTGSYTWPGWH